MTVLSTLITTDYMRHVSDAIRWKELKKLNSRLSHMRRHNLITIIFCNNGSSVSQSLDRLRSGECI